MNPCGVEPWTDSATFNESMTQSLKLSMIRCLRYTAATGDNGHGADVPFFLDLSLTHDCIPIGFA
jgi:hypothetical protein